MGDTMMDVDFRDANCQVCLKDKDKMRFQAMLQEAVSYLQKAKRYDYSLFLGVEILSMDKYKSRVNETNVGIFRHHKQRSPAKFHFGIIDHAMHWEFWKPAFALGNRAKLAALGFNESEAEQMEPVPYGDRFLERIIDFFNGKEASGGSMGLFES